MKNTLKYIKSIFTHKWYVFRAGLKIGDIPIHRLIIHDWTKFTPSEIGAYRDRIANKGKVLDIEKWGRAWHHHYMRSPHHWEYWRFDWQGDPRYYDGIVVDGCLEMPWAYAREMCADWMGTSYIYTGSRDMTKWLEKNLTKMKLHPKTKAKVLLTLHAQGYNIPEFSPFLFSQSEQCMQAMKSINTERLYAHN